MNVRLLDCTLRDGGFINDWDFGKKTMRSFYRRLNKASIDIIEIGFVFCRQLKEKAFRIRSAGFGCDTFRQGNVGFDRPYQYVYI